MQRYKKITAVVLRCGKKMKKLPHYHFSWIVSFQKLRYHVCEILGDRRGLLSFEGGSSRSH
jgi:hypothetical protein